MAIVNSPPASTKFKAATVFLILTFIIHIGGFAYPRWCKLKVSAVVWFFTVSGTYYSGLWADCGCVSFVCVCFPKVYFPGWLHAVRFFETIGLIGLLISAVLSVIIVCKCQQNKRIKLFNIICAAVSGVCIIIGVIAFGVESVADAQNLFSFIESIPLDIDTKASVHLGLAASASAGSLCLVLCVSLLVYDYLKPNPPAVQEVNPLPLQYLPQGPMSLASPTQTTVLVNTPALTLEQPGNVQPVQGIQVPTYIPQPGYVQPVQGMLGAPVYTSHPGYVQTCQGMQGAPAYTTQPGYVQTGQVMQEAPAYTPKIQSSGSQNLHDEEDVPHKS